MPTPPTIKTARELIGEAQQILDRCDRQGFNRETEARVDKLLQLAALAQAGETDSSNAPGKYRPLTSRC